MSLYVDGELAASADSAPDLITGGTASPTFLGYAGNPWYQYTGLIDEARVFTHALSEDDIADLYAGETTGIVAPVPLSLTVHNVAPEVSIAGMPAGTDDLSEDELAALVTRDAMIGVARPTGPTVPAA